MKYEWVVVVVLSSTLLPTTEESTSFSTDTTKNSIAESESIKYSIKEYNEVDGSQLYCIEYNIILVIFSIHFYSIDTENFFKKNTTRNIF